MIFSKVPYRDYTIREFMGKGKNDLPHLPDNATSTGQSLSLYSVLCCLSEQCSHEEQGVRIILQWWRRGESNSCPKTYPYGFLRVYPVIYIPLHERQWAGLRTW